MKAQMAANLAAYMVLGLAVVFAVGMVLRGGMVLCDHLVYVVMPRLWGRWRDRRRQRWATRG